MSLKKIKHSYLQKKRELQKNLKKDKAVGKEEYKSEIRSLKANHTKQVDEYYEQIGVARPIDPPKRSILEEVGNSVTHGAGAIFAIVACVLMMITAENPSEYVGGAIYSFGLVITFTVSCLYHAFPHGSTVKRVFRRFDYSSIYILIAATFAPVLLAVFSNTFGFVFFGVQWFIVAFGITMVAVFGPTKLRFLHIPLYVILGWSALMLIPGMMSAAPPLFYYILAGGVVYSLGLIPFVLHKKASHFIWHFFVVVGAIVQWIGIYSYVYLV